MSSVPLSDLDQPPRRVVLGIVFMTAATAQIALETRRIPTRCLVVLGLCVVITAMTPLGWTLWTEIPPTLARLRHHQVLEWKPAGLGDLPLLPFWLIATAVAVLGVRWLSQQVRGTAVKRCGARLDRFTRSSSSRRSGLTGSTRGPRSMPRRSWVP